MQTQSDQINEIVDALSKAQGEIPHAIFDSTNPHFKSKYASYEAFRKACQDPLSKNGLCIAHHLDLTPEGKRMMITQLSHKSGQWLRSFLILPIKDETAHGIGSGITYAKRYTLGGLLAIGNDEDDDANEAQYPSSAKEAKKEEPKKEKMINEFEALRIEQAMKDHPEDFKKMLTYYSDRLGYPVTKVSDIPENKLKPIWDTINAKLKLSHPSPEETIPF